MRKGRGIWKWEGKRKNVNNADGGECKEIFDLCMELIRYRDIDTRQIAEAAWKEGIIQCREIYKDAPDWVVDEMIKMLGDDAADSRTAGYLLLCLAQAGGGKVFRAFLDLERHPRKWREKLYVGPAVYAAYGGWSFDSDGKFLETNFGKCYPMVKGTEEEKRKSPVKIGVGTAEKCPHCGGRIMNRFAFWIQDCEIRSCPGCGKPMKYLAQIQWDTVMDAMEGNAYIEICRECKIMAVLHQQT